MTTISRTTAAVKASATKSHTHSVTVHDLIGTLDAAVAPALRGDIPEYGTISTLWTQAREGLKDSAADLERTHGQAQAYAVVCEIIEREDWKVLENPTEVLVRFTAWRAARSAAHALEYKAKLTAAHKESRSAQGRVKKGRAGGRKPSRGRAKVAEARAAEKVAKTEADAAKKTAASLGKGAKAAKYGGNTLIVASSAADGYGQWQYDSKKHPHMSDKTKAARATTVAAASGGGAIAGAEAGGVAGAWGGGAIGTFICPGPGTAVGVVLGGAVGGIGGGIAGSELGKAGAHAALESGHAVSSAAHKAGSGAKKGAKAVGHFVTHPSTPW